MIPAFAGSNPASPVYGILAQMVEHLTFNQVVRGSNPRCLIEFVRIQNADVAELADALDLGSSGRPWGFKSLHPQFRGPSHFDLVFFAL